MRSYHGWRIHASPMHSRCIFVNFKIGRDPGNGGYGNHPRRGRLDFGHRYFFWLYAAMRLLPIWRVTMSRQQPHPATGPREKIFSSKDTWRLPGIQSHHRQKGPGAWGKWPRILKKQQMLDFPQNPCTNIFMSSLVFTSGGVK
jgi:hypothetical protein